MQGQPLSIFVGLLLKIEPLDCPVYPGIALVHARTLSQFQRHPARAQALKLRVTGRLDQRLRHRTRQPWKIPLNGFGLRRK